MRQRPAGMIPAGLLVVCRSLSFSVVLCRTLPTKTHRGAGRSQLPCVLQQSNYFFFAAFFVAFFFVAFFAAFFLAAIVLSPDKEGLSLAIPR